MALPASDVVGDQSILMKVSNQNLFVSVVDRIPGSSYNLHSTYLQHTHKYSSNDVQWHICTHSTISIYGDGK